MAALLFAAPALAEWQPIPASCKPTKPPIASREAAVCVAIDRVGRDELSRSRHTFRYDVRESDGTWRVYLSPVERNVVGDDYTVDIMKKTGTVIGVRF